MVAQATNALEKFVGGLQIRDLRRFRDFKHQLFANIPARLQYFVQLAHKIRAFQRAPRQVHGDAERITPGTGLGNLANHLVAHGNVEIADDAYLFGESNKFER